VKDAAGEVQPSGIMDAPLQIPLTDLSNELSSAFSSGSIQSASSFPSGLEMAPEGTIVAGNHAAGPLKMVADGRGAQSSHSYDPVTSTSAKSVNSGEGEEVQLLLRDCMRKRPSFAQRLLQLLSTAGCGAGISKKSISCHKWIGEAHSP
jgi:hypothetical protein